MVAAANRKRCIFIFNCSLAFSHDGMTGTRFGIDKNYLITCPTFNLIRFSFIRRVERWQTDYIFRDWISVRSESEFNREIDNWRLRHTFPSIKSQISIRYTAFACRGENTNFFFSPAKMLRRMTETGKTFYNFDFNQRIQPRRLDYDNMHRAQQWLVVSVTCVMIVVLSSSQPHQQQADANVLLYMISISIQQQIISKMSFAIENVDGDQTRTRTRERARGPMAWNYNNKRNSSEFPVICGESRRQ